VTPEEQLRRRLQELTKAAIVLIEQCERLVEPEIRIGQSTYRLDRKQAVELYACIEETDHCLRKLLVNI
jgi:16S rRNA U1498 N3-methylase RsmE